MLTLTELPSYRHVSDLIDDLLEMLPHGSHLENPSNLAKRHAHLQRALLLVEHHAALLNQRVHGRNLLEAIAFQGSSDLFSAMTQCSHDESLWIEQFGFHIKSPTHLKSMTYWAAHHISLDILNMIMEHDHLLLKIDDGTTIAHRAACQGNLTLLQTLQATQNELIHQPDQQGHTPSFYAALYQHEELMAYFEEQSRSLSDPQYTQHLISSARGTALYHFRLAATDDCWWGMSSETYESVLQQYQQAIRSFNEIPLIERFVTDISFLTHSYGRCSVLSIALNREADSTRDYYRLFQKTFKSLQKRRSQQQELLSITEEFVHQECQESVLSWINDNYQACAINEAELPDAENTSRDQTKSPDAEDTSRDQTESPDAEDTSRDRTESPETSILVEDSATIKASSPSPSRPTFDTFFTEGTPVFEIGTSVPRSHKKRRNVSFA